MATGFVKFVLALAFALSIYTCTFALSDGARLSKLQGELSRKRDKVLAWNVATFEKYVEDAPRSYSLIVLITADPAMCKPCPVMREEFGKVAREYYSLPRKSQASQELYFAELRVSLEDREFLIAYGVEHVPLLLHFSSGQTKKYPAKISAKSSDNYNVQEFGISANSMKAFVNKRAKAKLRVLRGDYQIPFVPTVRALMPVIILGTAAIAVTALVLGWHKQPMFWFACCVVVYMYSVGGGHYSWINNSAFAVVNANGVTQYISDGSRNQYVAEGVFVAVICSLISGIVILMNELPRVLPNKGAQATVGHILCALAFLSIQFLLGLYQLKMPGYMRYEA